MLKQVLTPAEILLQHKLKEQFPGYRFRAQYPVNYFIADFYCHQARLIVEVDGGVHDTVDQPEYNANRTHIVQESGLTVIWFRNEEVEQDIKQVLTKIGQLLPESPPTP